MMAADAGIVFRTSLRLARKLPCKWNRNAP